MALSVSAALLANRKHARNQEEESETSNEASIEASLRNLSRPRIRGVRGSTGVVGLFGPAGVGLYFTVYVIPA